MCGRFTLRASLAEVAEFFELTRLPEWEWAPRYNIAPSQSIVALRLGGEHRRELARLRWGLVPHWARDESIGPRMINARAETAAEKPAFRAAMARRRCLIPADGFYEWRRVQGRRQPYLIEREDGGLFAMAGLWERWRPHDDAATVESVAILTVPANGPITAVHHRMPAVLERSQFARWLGERAEEGSASELLGPYTAPLRIREVSTYVNQATHEGPACIEPVKSVDPPLFP